MDEMEIEGMEKKAKVPKLRFPGFTGEWEERKLGEVMERYEKPVVTPHTGYNRLGIRSHAKGTFHNHVEAGEELETAQMYEVVANNFIVNITFAWEHAVAITDKDDTGKLVSHRFPQFQFTAGNIPCFFKYVIADPRFKYHLGLASPGGAGRNRVLNINEMLKYVVRVPAREEQEQIGKFLGKVDENILFYQRKLTHLQAKKKCLLQKMFPKKGKRFPELRFPGFTDAWEQKKLGDIGTVAMCKRIFKEQTVDEGEIPFYKIGTFGGEADAYISRELFENFKQEYSYPEVGDVLISASGSVGRTVVYKGEDAYFQDSNIVWLKHDGCVDNSFLGQFYSMIPWQGLEGSTIKRLYNKNILETEIYLPVEKEQKKIGLFLGRFDKLIALHERKLIYLQIQKKALLQQMFV